MKRIIISLLAFILVSTNILAWEDCPYGEVDEAYPGTCSRYVDTDKDYICDLSQTRPEDRVLDAKEELIEAVAIPTVEPVTIPTIEAPVEEKVHCGKHTEAEIAANEGNYIEEEKTEIESCSGKENQETVGCSTEDEFHDIINGRELKEKTVEEVAKLYEIDANTYAAALSNHYDTTVSPSTSFQILHDEIRLEPSTAKDIAASIKTGEYIESEKEIINLEENDEANDKEKVGNTEAETKVNIEEINEKNEVIEETPQTEGKYIYHLLPITLVLGILYTISYILAESKTIKLITHRRIWNVLLLISFLISGILGVLLIISINFGIRFSLPFNSLFWHVEAGIVMFDICMIHIFERRQFFLNMIRKGS